VRSEEIDVGLRLDQRRTLVAFDLDHEDVALFPKAGEQLPADLEGRRAVGRGLLGLGKAERELPDVIETHHEDDRRRFRLEGRAPRERRRPGASN